MGFGWLIHPQGVSKSSLLNNRGKVSTSCDMVSEMKYKNPVVPGCYPDPSICRAGDDFFLVNSSFEFFPGVPVSHSRDLVHWKTVGHCISRNSQLKLAVGRQNNSGIYAPSIRYHDGIFYMITTNVSERGEDKGNFYVWTEDPFGEWSDPIFLNTPGIDPSLFFDEDGKSYYIGTCPEGIYIDEIDLQEGKIVGPHITIWKGTGGSYPEGPHLYKKDGWYYLLISEGGTERCHMLTMARCRTIDGFYESCPYNPVMTNRSFLLPIQSVGHADLVQDQHGNWWAVCLGTRTFSYPPKHNLGRETMLVPVDWSGEWPIFGNNGKVEEEVEVSCLPSENVSVKETNMSFEDCFNGEQLDLSWNFIYNPNSKQWKLGKEGLELYGNKKSLADADVIAWIGRRQQHHESTTRVELRFPCVQEGEEAGLTIFMNNRHHYEAALSQKDGRRKLIFRRQIGSLQKIEKEIDYDNDTVVLELKSNLDYYTFNYQMSEHDKVRELGRGEVSYLTTEVGGSFTGNYIGLYSVGNGEKCITPAIFRNYHYFT